MDIEGILKAGTVVLARLAETCGALAIGYAVIRAAIAFVANALRGPAAEVPKEAIRLSLGRSLALGLEFLLGADILNTAVVPSWEQVGLLAAIATIRTGLNYFLQQELTVRLPWSATRPTRPRGPARQGRSRCQAARVGTAVGIAGS